jgi:hypothetical protein
MTAATNAAVIQLLEVDAAFKLHATAVGTADVRLVFVHRNTLQTTRVGPKSATALTLAWLGPAYLGHLQYYHGTTF